MSGYWPRAATAKVTGTGKTTNNPRAGARMRRLPAPTTATSAASFCSWLQGGSCDRPSDAERFEAKTFSEWRVRTEP